MSRIQEDKQYAKNMFFTFDSIEPLETTHLNLFDLLFRFAP